MDKKVVSVFVVLGDIVRVSSMMTNWGFAVVSLDEVLTCIVKCGKYMRPFVVSMTTLLFLIKCNPINGHVGFFITTKCSRKILSPFSNFSAAVANDFSSWPLAPCIWKLGGSLFLSYLELSVLMCPSHSGWLHWRWLLSLPRYLLLGYSRNLEAQAVFLVFFQDNPRR